MCQNVGNDDSLFFSPLEFFFCLETELKSAGFLESDLCCATAVSNCIIERIGGYEILRLSYSHFSSGDHARM